MEGELENKGLATEVILALKSPLNIFLLSVCAYLLYKICRPNSNEVSSNFLTLVQGSATFYVKRTKLTEKFFLNINIKKKLASHSIFVKKK